MKFKKKLFSCFLAATLVIPINTIVHGESQVNVEEAVIYAEVTNYDDGTSAVYEVNGTAKNENLEVNGEEVIASTYTLFFPAEEGALVAPRASGSGSKNEAGVTATITIYHTPLKSNGLFRITAFGGSWTSSAAYNVISDRIAGCKDGYLTNKLQYVPTSNSFYYTTGWGDVSYYAHTDLGPSAWSEATVTPQGMGSAKHRIVLYYPLIL